MKKILLLIMSLGMVYNVLQAQQDLYKVRIGGAAGFASYYGDLSYKFFKQSNANLAYHGAIEYLPVKCWGFRLSYLGGSFSANDRKYEDSPNFDRALNFKTHYLAGDFKAVYYFDNGKVFNEKLFLSPYLFVGAGIMKYDVFADLFDENGQQYFYWNDGTIRNMHEFSANSAQAQIIHKNGVYETGLRALNTEGVNYKKYAWYLPFGMGLKFRITKHINLNWETQINYVFSDYLDDVSTNPVNPNLSSSLAQYAANPNGTISGNRSTTKREMNDFFFYTNASISINFGRRKHDFDGPNLYMPKAADMSVSDPQPASSQNNNEAEENDFAAKLQREKDSLNMAMMQSTLHEEQIELKKSDSIQATSYFQPIITVDTIQKVNKPIDLETNEVEIPLNDSVNLNVPKNEIPETLQVVKPFNENVKPVESVNNKQTAERTDTITTLSQLETKNVTDEKSTQSELTEYKNIPSETQVSTMPNSNNVLDKSVETSLVKEEIPLIVLSQNVSDTAVTAIHCDTALLAKNDTFVVTVDDLNLVPIYYSIMIDSINYLKNTEIRLKDMLSAYQNGFEHSTNDLNSIDSQLTNIFQSYRNTWKEKYNIDWIYPAQNDTEKVISNVINAALIQYMNKLNCLKKDVELLRD